GARGVQPPADLLGLAPRVGADPHLIKIARAAAAETAAQDDGVGAGERAAVARLELRVGLERAVAREAGGELGAPGARDADVDALLQLGDEHVGRALSELRDERRTQRRRCGVRAVLRVAPLLDRVAR